jgi:hypothetical protein
MHSPDGGEDSLTYVEKIDTEVEIGTCEERVEATTEMFHMRKRWRRKRKLARSCKIKLLRREFWMRHSQWWSRRKKYQLRNRMLL